MKVCAICGKKEATTKDHVPPKAIFPKPRPENLIRVPACTDCNNGASVYDDLFKVYLSMQVAGQSEISSRLFREKTARTLKHNRKLLTQLAEKSKELHIENENGNLVTRTGVLWDSEAHDIVMERIIRGLYFHHKGNVLPSDTILRVQWLHGIPEDTESKLHLFTEATIGNDQVIYKYFIYDKDPRFSLWLFEFYGAHWASGHTSPDVF
jgi:hypothetical protein